MLCPFNVQDGRLCVGVTALPESTWYFSDFVVMKRQHERDGSPKSSRQYQAYSDYSSRDHLSPERDRRERSSRGRDARDRESRDYDYDRISTKRHAREDRDSERYSGSGRGNDRESQPYRTLCLSSFHQRVQDGDIRDALYKEFDRFGEFNVKVVHSNYNDSTKIAFVNFRYHESARAARHEVTDKLYLFNTPLRVEPVYNNRPYESYQNNQHWRERGGQYSSGPTNSGSTQRPGYESASRDRDFQGPGYRQDQGHGRRQDFSREKDYRFPHHLNHIEPEDDDKATRTLFVGNLEINIEDNLLRETFERYGQVTDIDIKRPMSGNAYAFVKFFNLDQAHKAKVAMSGQHIGSLQCKIGYGKPSLSPCLWVGGLGSWLNIEVLEREFDRFGVIHMIEWPQDCNYAYVVYDSVEVAQAAMKEMRGFPIGGPEHRLRVDFADLGQLAGPIPPELKLQFDKELKAKETNGKDQTQFLGQNQERNRTNSKNDWSSGSRVDDYDKKRAGEDQFSDSSERRRGNSRNYVDDGDRGIKSGGEQTPPRDRDSDRGSSRMLSPSGEPSLKRSRLSPDHLRNSGPEEKASDGSMPPGYGVEQAASIPELMKLLPVVWSGALILKNSAFLTRLYLLNGDVHLVDTLLRDPTSTEMPVLKISQRLRLDKAKVEDVNKRISLAGSGGSCVLIAQQNAGSNVEEPSEHQSRPLKNLVSYLKQKEAAGIISLPPNPSAKYKDTGVLHAVPPCQFSHEFLTKHAPSLSLESAKEDFLVVVVVRGSN